MASKRHNLIVLSFFLLVGMTGCGTLQVQPISTPVPTGTIEPLISTVPVSSTALTATPSETITISQSSTPVNLPPVPGHYIGINPNVSFDLSGREITNFTITIPLDVHICNLDASSAINLLPDGSFSAGDYKSPNKISGKVNGDRVNGNYSLGICLEGRQGIAFASAHEGKWSASLNGQYAEENVPTFTQVPTNTFELTPTHDPNNVNAPNIILESASDLNHESISNLMQGAKIIKNISLKISNAASWTLKGASFKPEGILIESSGEQSYAMLADTITGGQGVSVKFDLTEPVDVVIMLIDLENNRNFELIASTGDATAMNRDGNNKIIGKFSPPISLKQGTTYQLEAATTQNNENILILWDVSQPEETVQASFIDSKPLKNLNYSLGFYASSGKLLIREVNLLAIDSSKTIITPESSATPE
ncbi:MAG: hypothetical protein AB9891_06955 [Anaerolineaceae bacterium]